MIGNNRLKCSGKIFPCQGFVGATNNIVYCICKDSIKVFYLLVTTFFSAFFCPAHSICQFGLKHNEFRFVILCHLLALNFSEKPSKLRGR